MATAQLTPPPAAGPAPGEPEAPRTGTAGALLLFALLAAAAFAIFAHGAQDDPSEARLQVALGVIAGLATIAWAWTGWLRPAASRAGWIGLGLLAGFAAFSGLTLFWSVAPDRTWIELNRAVAYVLVVALAIAAGASARRPLERAGLGYLAIATVVALYALGGKLLPGVHLGGLVHLDQTDTFSRLRAPLQYWNALAAVLVLAVPIALRVVADAERPRRARLVALAALDVLLTVIGLTYSRGGILALICATAVVVWLSPARLRMLTALVLAIAAAAPTLALCFGLHSLSAGNVPLASRETAGLVALALFLVGLGVLLGVARIGLALERRHLPNPALARTVWRGLGRLLVAVILLGVLALLVSSRGLPGTISHEWKVFRTPQGENVTDPTRLLSTSSGNRWVWWSEAAGAFSDRPWGGWGAGSFPVTHLMYRHNRLNVLQPHNVPLQFLAEDGIAGALLALGGLGALLAAALAAVAQLGRRLPPGWRLAPGLAAAGVGYAVHIVFDWDWDIPGVTIPALLLVGVLVGAAGREAAGRGAAGLRAAPPRGRIAAGLALAGITLLLATYAASAALPSIASGKANTALLLAAEANSQAQLEHAAKVAELASRLDPLSDDGLIAAAQIAQRRGLLERSRAYLLKAVRRDPSDVAAWTALARIEFFRLDVASMARAAERALALDPRGLDARALAVQADALRAPPSSSATATGTPLPTIQ